ncbi:MAG TPA: alpha/beta hydrolase [Burkholderiales bacterium]|nr:alpha/beta hydrolase [Burkholderiales bacterium]
MNQPSAPRRHFLKTTAVLGAAGLAGCAHTGPAAPAKIAYSPNAQFELKVFEVEYRRNPQGRALMARVYQPQGAGPFPVMVDLHGGAWNAKDRTAEQPMNRAVAASGVLVVAIDLTLASQAPYPASVQDANYGVRWVKTRAAGWNGDPTTLGLYGSSSGGHVAELLVLRPDDARYNAIPLSSAPNVNAHVAYMAARSPISNTWGRYQNAEDKKRERMMNNNKAYFVPWEAIHESNPQEILERREKVGMVPILIMQGLLDDNMLPRLQEKFVAALKTAGADVSFTEFEGSVHEWTAEPGPQTTRAQQMVKAFIAKQMAAGRRAA